MKRTVGIIGYPLKHSISPIFQQAAFDHLQMDIRYEAWETDPREVAQVVNRLRDTAYLGMNVTIPFKEVVIPLLDQVDKSARQIGAVNTIVNHEGRLTGFTTDASGFIRALREQANFDTKGAKATVLGAGGAARAIAFALSEAGASSIHVLNRSLERAEALAHDLRQFSASPDSIVSLPLTRTESTQVVTLQSDLIVNTTSVGMKHGSAEGETPLTADFIPRRALVNDIVYNPPETPFLREAEKAGARTLGGLPMLVYQGAAAFQLWTGHPAPVTLMLSVAKSALA